MRLMFATAFAALAVACSPAAPAAPTAEEIAKASADLTAYLDAEYEEGLAMSPMRLTTLGRKEQQDKLDDFSDAAADKELAWMRESVAEMKAKVITPSRSESRGIPPSPDGPGEAALCSLLTTRAGSCQGD